MATDTDRDTVDEIQQLELVERVNEPIIKLHVFLMFFLLIFYIFFPVSFSHSRLRVGS